MNHSVGSRPIRWTSFDSYLDDWLTFLQPFVTELDLRLAQLPPGAIDYLREVMPNTTTEGGEPEYDYDRWLYDVFA